MCIMSHLYGIIGRDYVSNECLSTSTVECSLASSSFEERAKCVENIVEKHKEHSTFEEFAAHMFAPVLPPQGMYTARAMHVAAC